MSEQKKHGVFVSFAVLADLAALMVVWAFGGLLIVFLDDPGKRWFVVALLLSAAVSYGWRLWGARGQCDYGLWEEE